MLGVNFSVLTFAGGFSVSGCHSPRSLRKTRGPSEYFLTGVEPHSGNAFDGSEGLGTLLRQQERARGDRMHEGPHAKVPGRRLVEQPFDLPAVGVMDLAARGIDDEFLE